MIRLKLLPLLLLCLLPSLLPSCANQPLTFQAAVQRVTQNPNNQQALNDLAAGVLAYTTGNTVGAAVDGAQGLTAFIWGLQGTAQSASPAAMQQAAVLAKTPALAAAVVTATAQLKANGTSPDQITNAIATTIFNATKQ